MNEKTSQEDRQTRLQIVDAADGDAQFGQAWDDLFARAVGASPYLSRAWVSTFIREGRIRGRPLFLLTWHGERLVALVPLAVRKAMGTRIAEPLGTGEPSYLGLLLDPDYPEAIERTAEAFRSERLLNVFCIEDLWSGDDATNEFIATLADKGFCVHRVYRNPCPFIRLACSYEEYIKNTKSAKSRQTLLRKERRLNKKHAVNVEDYPGTEMTEEILARVASVQEQSWMKKRGAAVLGQPFYKKLVLSMADAGLARMWLMTIDGVDAAFVLAAVVHKRLYYLWTAFTLEHASSLSIGQYLTNQTIRHACADGIKEYDFIHGDAQYKRFWSTDSHDVYRAIAGKGVWGRCLATAHSMSWRLARVESLRRLRQQFRSTLRRLKRGG